MLRLVHVQCTCTHISTTFNSIALSFFSLFTNLLFKYTSFTDKTPKNVCELEKENKKEKPTTLWSCLSRSCNSTLFFSLVTFFLSIFCKTTRKWRNCFVFFSQMIVVAQQKMSIMMISILLKRIPT